MRLSDAERTIIKHEATRLDPRARVFLFGSRTDDDALGGDIDLLIDSDLFDLARTAEFRWGLMEKLGEQKFDIVNARRAQQDFVALIRAHAVEL